MRFIFTTENIFDMRYFVLFVLAFFAVCCSGSKKNDAAPVQVEPKAPVLEYGIEVGKYDVEPGEVKKGDFFGSIMEDFGVGANQVQKILKASEGVFDVKKIKLGNSYEVLREKDSLGQAAFFVYELDNLSYAVLSLKDSLYARIYEKEVVPVRKKAEVTITPPENYQDFDEIR